MTTQALHIWTWKRRLPGLLTLNISAAVQQGAPWNRFGFSPGNQKTADAHNQRRLCIGVGQAPAAKREVRGASVTKACPAPAR